MTVAAKPTIHYYTPLGRPAEQKSVSGTNLLDCVEGGAVAADAGSDDHEVVVKPAARSRAIASRRRSRHAPPSGHQLRRVEPEGLAPEPAEAEPGNRAGRVVPVGGGGRRRSRGEGHDRGVHGDSEWTGDGFSSDSVRGDAGRGVTEEDEVKWAEAARVG